MARVACLLVVLVVSGCMGGGHTNQATGAPSTATSASDKPCDVPPLVGHWKVREGEWNDYYAPRVPANEPARYAYTINQTRHNGTYEVVHEDHDADCRYGTVAALIFLKAEPGVATWRFEAATRASIENDRAWDDRPPLFHVDRVDNATSPP
jgi:hypothetical protein